MFLKDSGLFGTRVTEQEKYRKDIVENDSSLAENEKNFLFNEFQKVYDALRIGYNSVEKQQCNNCQNWHQATQYCEFCIRKYLENNFGNWTSGNSEIDKLIQECQQTTVSPVKVIEWISYDQFENIKYLSKGGCATIYTVIWKDGGYNKWNSERQILERSGRHLIVLKRLNHSIVIMCFGFKKHFLKDFDIHKTVTEQEKYRKDIVENDSSLAENEKNFLFNEFQKVYDALRIGYNSVEKQQCNNCQNWHQATQYCEFCIRKYLENNFGNWTSGNSEIDKLIQECQQTTVSPVKVIEWISYDQFENIKYLSKGGCATIYTVIWKDGGYNKWNSERQILERSGRHLIVLKRLNHSIVIMCFGFKNFTLDDTSEFLASFLGLTKDPTTQDYMLVSIYYNNDLRHFLKDLHLGNILYFAQNNVWNIDDLGSSGPVNKQFDGIYGNLPYITPNFIEKIKSIIRSLYNEMDKHQESTIPNSSKSNFSQSSLTKEKKQQLGKIT
ncbi:hypothetical protein Glove_220g20 [Diversispora epigaea]|uniref:Protein kinase domain-containing protein n=1 Tax=Diversispora epigaea TaxID=1348612 RepID=A0A397INM5_9GLOM|nr:hypothetical protein Glove_220g20 [Diversispora epigaea]